VKIVARDMDGYEALTHRLFAQDERVRSFMTLVGIRQTKKVSLIPIATDLP
jgi:Lrp/AsnC family leucine-responsive transcriptional regulator